MRLDALGWLSNIRKSPSPNFNSRPPSTTVDLLVIHYISLPEGQFGLGYPEALFLNTLDPAAHPDFPVIAPLKVSAHFLVDREGVITQFVSVHDRAWHAGQSSFEGRPDCNNFSIGIELEGWDSGPFEEAQYQALKSITQLLMAAFPGITTDHIVGHSDIAPGRKQDPGPYFDWAYYRKLIT